MKKVRDRVLYIQTDDALIAQLEGALDLSERLKEPTLTYLIERALDEARSKSISGIKGDDLLVRH